MTSTPVLSPGCQEFATELFSQYPDLSSTKALYLDLEGSGLGTDAVPGTEYVLTMCWPQRGHPARYQRIRRPSLSEDMTGRQLNAALRAFGMNLTELKHVVVFSGGLGEPDEKIRFEKVFGEGSLGNPNWVNLHALVRRSPQMKRDIRDSRWVWFHRDRTRTRYSLEAVEHEFGIRRPVRARAHTNRYRDEIPGAARPLELARAWMNGSASDEDIAQLMDYTRQDVESMFKLTQMCQRWFQAQ